MTIEEALKRLEYGIEQMTMELKSGLWETGSDSEAQVKQGIELNQQHIAWLTELKELREENKVLISERDRLIKKKGELLKKSEQISECKRLLRLAVEDMTKEADCGICLHDNDGECPIEVTGCKFKWRHADETLKLIEDDTP